MAYRKATVVADEHKDFLPAPNTKSSSDGVNGDKDLSGLPPVMIDSSKQVQNYRNFVDKDYSQHSNE